jgi:hypothetical protein
MTKLFSLVLALALVSIITIAGTATASAKGKKGEEINFSTVLYVTALPEVETNTHSGWSTIDLETLAGTGLLSNATGPIDLNGLYITAEQSSHEQFTNPVFLPATNVKKGKSKGTFYLSPPISATEFGAPVVVGNYQLKVSTIEGCQIYGEGKWKSKAKNSAIEGKGEITVCTNWVWLSATEGTFFSLVNVTGSAVAAD